MSEKEFSPEFPPEIKEAIRLHATVRSYAIDANTESADKFNSQSTPMARSALSVLSHDCLTVHHAIVMLCMSGWSSPAAVLVRTQMDILISTMAITQHEKSELMAYKYLYLSFRQAIRDGTFPAAEQERSRKTCLDGLKLLSDDIGEEAKSYIFKGKRANYWYAQEYHRPTDFLREHSGHPEWERIYKDLSRAAHGGYMGMRLFRDGADGLDIGPREPGTAAERAIGLSAFVMLEQTYSRSLFEGLTFVDQYPDLKREVEALLGRAMASRITDEDRRRMPLHQTIKQ